MDVGCKHRYSCDRILQYSIGIQSITIPSVTAPRQVAMALRRFDAATAQADAEELCVAGHAPTVAVPCAFGGCSGSRGRGDESANRKRKLATISHSRSTEAPCSTALQALCSYMHRTTARGFRRFTSTAVIATARARRGVPRHVRPPASRHGMRVIPTMKFTDTHGHCSILTHSLSRSSAHRGRRRNMTRKPPCLTSFYTCTSQQPVSPTDMLTLISAVPHGSDMLTEQARAARGRWEAADGRKISCGWVRRGPRRRFLVH